MSPKLYMELRAEQREILAMCLPELRYPYSPIKNQETETIRRKANESNGRTEYGRIREAWAQSV